MAIQSGEIALKQFSMKDDVEPKTIVYGKPLTEGQRRTVVKTNRRGEIDYDEEKLFRMALSSNDKGVFIANVIVDGQLLTEVKDRDKAVEYLMSCRDVIFMEQLKSWMMGMTDLDLAESKNFVSQSKPS